MWFENRLKINKLINVEMPVFPHTEQSLIEILFRIVVINKY